MDQIRQIIRKHGLKSHKIRFSTGRRPVFITGIGVVGHKLIAPFALNLKIQECWADYHAANTILERDQCIQTLLANLGTARFIAGPKTAAGQKLSSEMNSLRQKKAKMYREDVAKSLRKREETRSLVDSSQMTDAPF